MINAVIIDDEIASIDSLEILLKNCDEDIRIRNKASNIDDAREIIEQHNPDLVFLDIEMPNGSGFDLLDSLENINFDIIFITAYNQYAIKAFKYAAVDYILKPVDFGTLQEAVSRIEKNKGTAQKINALKANIQSENPQRLALPTQDTIEIVNTEDIIHFQADGPYTKIHIAGSNPIIISKMIKEYEDILSSDQFFRCHKSHLINFKHVKKVLKNQNAVEMIDNSIAYISRRKKNEFFEAMQQFLAQ